MILTERFWDKVAKTETCWNWTASTDRGGYGVWTPPRGSGIRMRMAHRFAYEAMVGPIPNGLELDHLCRNRTCVNPDHLEAVTHQENMRRYEQSKTHCASGHQYDEANTLIDPRGYKRCRTCNRERARIRTGYYERPRRWAA
jgi:hypothetical protein